MLGIHSGKRLAATGSQDFQNALMDTYLKGFAKDTGFVPSTDAFCCGTSNLKQHVDTGQRQVERAAVFQLGGVRGRQEGRPAREARPEGHPADVAIAVTVEDQK
ncbi:MAG: hypothetical protein M9924_20185 [Rhizobiaceae bacterium]|nr:hypothetical protein [Rhizobiaceae bacterium]